MGRAAVVTAWVLRHPAFVQVLTGTTSVEHLKEQCEYEKVTMTHGEWYDIYKAAGNQCTM